MGGIPSNQYIIAERRKRVIIMLSQGLSEKEISCKLKVGQSTICRDLKSIKKESQKSLESVLKDVLPYEYTKSVSCMDQVIKQCWTIIEDTSGEWTNKNKLDALKLLKETSKTKIEILNQGPANLFAQKLEQDVKELTELVKEDETPQKSFFTLGPPPGGYGELQ